MQIFSLRIFRQKLEYNVYNNWNKNFTIIGIGAYVGNIVSWTDMSNDVDNLINYTIKIDDDEFDVESELFDMRDYKPGVYKVQVKVNYDEGSSIWTRPYYANIDGGGLQLEASYNFASETDFHYNLENSEEIIAVIGSYYVYSIYVPLPKEIVSIDGSGFTINHYYIETKGNKLEVLDSLVMGIYIVTADDIYTLYILNQPS